jgi:asparagine synthase (glutamine-hydrolysing)
MCGILGLIDYRHNDYRADSFDQFSKSMPHRGPDDKGEFKEGTVYFGHQRLSLIDLSAAGHQPMQSGDGNCTIVFNGEIYNFIELRKELETLGHRFISTSDTEVILEAYSEWGTASFSRFNGMFAFALFVRELDVVYLVRDHAAIKPLYYSLDNNTLLFASEVRAFKAYNPDWHANPDWQVCFLTMGFIPFPYTTLLGVKSLPKGHFLEYHISRHKSIVTRFHKFNFSSAIDNEEEALSKIRELMFAATERHLISDAPIGIFLSGGIDSSLLALIADKLGQDNLNTLSVTFDEATFNEEPYQEMVLDRMRPHKHYAYKVNEQMFIDHLQDIFKAMDQPSWDGVNSYFISKCAHDAGLKAVLSGLGADEIFGGYPSFNRIGLLKKCALLPGLLRRMASYSSKNALSRLAFLNLKSNYNEYLFLRGGFNPATVAQLTGKKEEEVIGILNSLHLTDYPKTKDKNLASFLETNVLMENQMLKDTDYMSMWHSLEVRVPFLDRELMETVYAIDPSIKYNTQRPKYLLTKAFEDLLPDGVVYRKKQGFTFPFSIWMLNNKELFKSMLPDNAVSHKIWNSFESGKVHWSRVWALIVMNLYI